MLINRQIFFLLICLCYWSIPSYAWYADVEKEHPIVKKEIDKLLLEMDENIYRDIDKVLTKSNQAIELAEEIYSTEDLLQIYSKVGLSYEHHNQPENALIYYNHALEYAEQLQDDLKILAVYNDLALTHRRMVDYKESEAYYLKAMTIAEERNDKAAQENTHHGLGSLYKDMGEYESAVKHYLTSIKIAEERGHIEYVIHSQQYLALTYAEAGNMSSAVEVIQEAVERAKSLPDTILNGIVIFDYGKILSKQKNLESAQKEFKKSLVLFESIGHKPLIARSLFYIADNYSKLGELDKAWEYFTQCQKYESFISLRGQADLNFKLGELHLNQLDAPQAKKYFLKSLELSEKQGLIDFSQQNHFQLFELYDDENKPARALFHLKKYTKLKDSIYTQEHDAAISEMRIKYDSEKKENEITSLQHKQEKINFYGILALFSTLVLALGGLVFLTKRNNIKLRTKNAEIEEKNNELKESNEILQQFAYVAAHDLKEPLRSIGSFSNLLKRRYANELNQEANEYLEYIQVAAKRMDKLLRSLLEYSGINMQKTGNKTVEPRRVLQEILQISQAKFKEKDAIIEAGELPQVRMNSTHLHQIFQNIISNSLKFTNGKPVIKIKATQVDERVIFRIADQGIGISKESGDKIFRLFYQEDRTDRMGAGMGLTICKTIIDKYKGKISFTSQKGQGTVFTFDLPAA